MKRYDKRGSTLRNAKCLGCPGREITGFDVALMEEARALARSLREQSANALTRTTPIAQREALGRRNLFTLLQDRVRRVRRTATYVYREYPTIVRKFTSAYERRRAAARRRTTSDVAPAPTGTEVTAKAS